VDTDAALLADLHADAETLREDDAA
jgi:hypothetical protein